MQSSFEKISKSSPCFPFQRGNPRSAILFILTAAAAITPYTKSYEIAAMTMHFFVKFNFSSPSLSLRYVTPTKGETVGLVLAFYESGRGVDPPLKIEAQIAFNLNSYSRKHLGLCMAFWSDWADAQADLSLRWAHISFCWFCHEAAQMCFGLCYYVLLDPWASWSPGLWEREFLVNCFAWFYFLCSDARFALVCDWAYLLVFLRLSFLHVGQNVNHMLWSNLPLVTTQQFTDICLKYITRPKSCTET